jgi:aromatic-L-amino-acid decarboxylase
MLIPTDDEHAMKPDALADAIAADRAAGRTPCAVVATCGTTATTAFDPIEKIAKIATGLWLHVDAAMAGSAMILPECRPLWRGVERADSVVFNPHKWLGVAFDCTAYYVRDPKTLVRVMSTNPSYLKTAADEKVRNLRDWGLQLGRRFRALKLWFLFREQGLEGLRARLRRDLENAQWLAAQVDATPGWERVAPVKLQTVCVRHKEADNLAIANRVNRSGRAYVTPSLLKGRQMIRVSIGAEATARAEVAAVWSLLQSEAKSVT